jgi:glycosyltransferase involved in cell wall biosynthesis
MKTSFIIITYNQVKYIFDALQSAEKQTILPDELIIADDCSSDLTKTIIEQFIEQSKIKNIVYFTNEQNLGIVGNVNKAINQAHGDIIFLQAGDDISCPNRIELTLKAFDKKNISLVLSSFNIIDEEGIYKKTKFRKGTLINPKQFIKKGAAYSPQGLAWRCKDLNRFLPIPPLLRNEDDYLTFLGTILGGIEIIQEPLYSFRINCGVSAWMYANNTPKETLIKNYRKDIPNRIENYKSWSSVLSKDQSTLIHMIQNKISIYNYMLDIDNLSYAYRLYLAFKYFHITNIREKSILVFGFNSLSYLAMIKRLLIA